jgi:photosystem II stability/assembly factor-like uncharacterized protein
MDDVIYGLAALSDSDNGKVLVARSSGLYMSSGANGDWNQVCNPDESPLPPTATAVAIKSAGYAFVGMQGGVLRTSNGGTDWYFSPLSVPPPVISCIAISPEFVSDGMLIVGTLEDGVFRSENRGGVWMPCNFGLLDMRVFSLAMSPNFLGDETIFAGTESGVFISTNAGRAWRETAFSMDNGSVLSLAISQSGTIFAGTENSAVWASEDSGKSWSRRDEHSLHGAVNQLHLLNDDGHLLALHDDHLLTSIDGGRAWHSLRADLPTGITAFATLDGTRLCIGLRDGQIQII